MPFFTGSSDVRIDNSYLSEIAGDFIVNRQSVGSNFSFESPDANDIELIFS